MSYYAIILLLCILAWVLTLDRIRSIRWKEVRQDHGIALNVWLMMVFFSITMIFLNKRFCNYFDAHTLNNLDRLIAYSSILIGMYHGAAASQKAVGTPPDASIIHSLKRLLILIISLLTVVYAFFISRIPNMDYYIPRSLPEVIFMLLTFLFGVVLCSFVIKLHFAHLPFEKSPVMRIRTKLIIFSTSLACTYFLVKILTVGGYFLPILGSQSLVTLSTILLVLSVLSHFSALLSNKVYLPLAVFSRNIESWNTFNDLKYLRDMLQQLCPEVILSTESPTLFAFLSNPEFHLYSAIITIMDGKTMLNDVLLEGELQGEPSLWEGDMLREAARVNRVLQAINPNGDFFEIVKEYRHASKDLETTHTIKFTAEAI